MRELQNETYERELIGSILQDNRILEEVSISSSDFIGTLTRRCFEAIREIKAKGGIADLASVVPLVGAQYVAEVAAMTNAATGNAAYYTKELRELSRLRNLATMTREASELIGNGKLSAEVAEHIEERLTAIADDRDHINKHCTETEVVMALLLMLRVVYPLEVMFGLMGSIG